MSDDDLEKAMLRDIEATPAPEREPTVYVEMCEEIEDLHALADECRVWARPADDAGRATPHVRACEAEFARIADKLDAIAKRIADYPR